MWLRVVLAASLAHIYTRTHEPRTCCLHRCRLDRSQGLPATVTSLLSLTALRLRDRKVLIKRTGTGR